MEQDVRLAAVAFGDARRERYIGEGVFGARERDTQRLSYVAFFWYFSWRSKKSTYTSCEKVSLFRNLRNPKYVSGGQSSVIMVYYML